MRCCKFVLLGFFFFAAVGVQSTSERLYATGAVHGGRTQRGTTETKPATRSTCGGLSVSPKDMQPGGTIQGHVTDANRRPIRGVKVSLQRLRYASGMTRHLEDQRTVVTNAAGEFDSKVLPPGEYYVSAVAQARGSFTENPRDNTRPPRKLGFGPTFYPGTTWFSRAESVFVYSGVIATGIDITLEQKPLARVSGKLISSGAGLKDGTYVALAPQATVGRAGLNGFLGVSQVSADGSFTIDDVPPGEYRLEGRSLPLRAVEAIAMTGRNGPLTSDPDAEFGSLPLMVDGADITNVQLTLARGGRIRGRVTMDGQPFRRSEGARAAIRAEPVNTDALNVGVTDARIGSNGEFEIRGVAGQFVLRLSGDLEGVALARVEADKRDVSDGGLFIDPGEEAIVDVTLTSRLTEVAGRVISDDRGDHSGCWVIVFAQDAQRWSWSATRYISASRVRLDDRFRIQGLPAGKYFAIAVSDVEEGQWQDPDYLNTLVRRAKAVDLGEAEKKIVDLHLVSGVRRE